MRFRLAFALAAAAFAVPQTAHAEKLFGVSGGSGLRSTLFTLDPQTGAILSRIGAEEAAGCTLMEIARHPTTGVLYGLTSFDGAALDGGNVNGYLVRVDVATGAVTLVARTRVPGVDAGVGGTRDVHGMRFASDGKLYAWSNGAIGQIDVATGVVTVQPPTGFGTEGIGFTLAGGRAMVMTGNLRSPYRLFDLSDAAVPVTTPANGYYDAGDAGATDMNLDNYLWAMDTRKDGVVFGIERATDRVTQDAGGADESRFPTYLSVLAPLDDAGITFDGGYPAASEVRVRRIGPTKRADGRWAQIAAIAFSMDEDDDGIVDQSDNCPSNANTPQTDGDGDGKGDACDPCPTVANPGAQACPVSDAGTDGGGSTGGSTGGTTGGSTGGTTGGTTGGSTAGTTGGTTAGATGGATAGATGGASGGSTTGTGDATSSKGCAIDPSDVPSNLGMSAMAAVVAAWFARRRRRT